MTTQKTKLIPFSIERWMKGDCAVVRRGEVVNKLWIRAHATYPVVYDIGMSNVYTATSDGLSFVDDTIRTLMLRVPDDTDPLDEICEGHNPDNLTRRQVETDKGFRLLAVEEICKNREITHEIWGWLPMARCWSDKGYEGSSEESTYRTQKPPGYFLPKPKRTRPLRASDWDGLPVVWIREAKVEWLVTGISQDRLSFLYTGECSNWLPFQTAYEYEMGWSTDRVNWKPFTVEETE